MRAFFQKKAGATYFQKCNITVSMRKHEIELIYALDKGWHAVINLLVTPTELTLLANMTDFGHKLDSSLDGLIFKDAEMPKFLELLEAKGEFSLLEINSIDGGQVTGMGMTIPNRYKTPFAVIGDPEITKTGSRLVSYVLALHNELSETDKAPLKKLVECFYD